MAEINWNQPALQLHNFIRGSDKIPGAWSTIDGQVNDENFVTILKSRITVLDINACVFHLTCYIYIVYSSCMVM